jgi:hypothetical protein
MLLKFKVWPEPGSSQKISNHDLGNAFKLSDLFEGPKIFLQKSYTVLRSKSRNIKLGLSKIKHNFRNVTSNNRCLQMFLSFCWQNNAFSVKSFASLLSANFVAYICYCKIYSKTTTSIFYIYSTTLVGTKSLMIMNMVSRRVHLTSTSNRFPGGSLHVIKILGRQIYKIVLRECEQQIEKSQHNKTDAIRFIAINV